MGETIFENSALIWIILGITGLLLELIAPGFIIIFFGFGALITALFSWMFHIHFEIQLTVFLISSGILLLLFRKVVKNSFGKNKTQSDKLEEEFVGKIGKAIGNFENNSGKVDFKGTSWSAYSEDTIKAGDSVEIIQRDSITLIVKLK